MRPRETFIKEKEIIEKIWIKLNVSFKKILLVDTGEITGIKIWHVSAKLLGKCQIAYFIRNLIVQDINQDTECHGSNWFRK